MKGPIVELTMSKDPNVEESGAKEIRDYVLATPRNIKKALKYIVRDRMQNAGRKQGTSASFLVQLSAEAH